MSDYLIWFAGAGGFLAVAWIAARTSVAEGRRAPAGQHPIGQRPASSTGIYRGIHYRTLPGRIEALIDGTVAARFISLDELREAVDTALEPAD